jgi:hypothetical protein
MSRRYKAFGTTMLLAVTTGTAVALSAQPAQAVINPADYQQVEMARGVAEMGEPISLAVLPDSSVLHTARGGQLRRTDNAGNTTVIGTIAVYSHDEEGLQGVGVDPNFASNRHIYLYYAPPLSTPAGDAPATGTSWTPWQGVNRLSRFTLNADWTVNTASQRTVLDVPADRGICCHVGGDIDFDAAGNLYLSTGDDTNPFDSAGYAPIDERANRNPAYDAQRSAGNTNDLRGKVLRIKVNADGSYSMPAVGNIHNGDWTAYSGINTNGATRFSARVSSNGTGGTIQVRSGSATGTLLGSVAVPITGGWETFTNVSITLTGNASGALHLVYAGSGTAALFDVDSFTLSTTGSGPIVGLASKCVDVRNGATADGTKIQLYTCNGTASQAWARNGQTWRALGKCLDIAGGGTADGTLVQLWTCNGTAAQNWVPGASSALINPSSGKCLDVAANNSANGTQIHIWTCNGAANQAWSLP